MVTLTFRGCVVRLISPLYMETVFPDGAKAPAFFVRDADAYATARAFGYGDDVLRMHREHDIVHTFLAEVHGLPHSPVLRRVAGGSDVPPDARASEEGLVLSFQRYLNTGQADLLLTDLHPDLPALADRFRALVRPIHTACAEWNE